MHFQKTKIYATYLDIREVGAHDAIHHTPDVRDRVLVADGNPKLFANKAASPLPTEQVLGAHGFDHVGVQTLKLHLSGVGRVVAVILESRDRPRTLDSRASFLDLVQKDTLDLPLVQQGGEGISGVDESRTAGPAARASDTLLIGQRIPESHIVHLGRVVRHHLAFQTQIAQDFNRSRLDTVCATCGCRHRPVVDMLDLVAPTGHTKRQQDAHRACPNNHNIIFLLRLRHGGGLVSRVVAIGTWGRNKEDNASTESTVQKLCRSAQL